MEHLNLYSANDLALLSHTQQMQEKTSIVMENTASLGLNIHRGKILKVNIALQILIANTSPITLEGEALVEVESFIYLDSIVYQQDMIDTNVRVSISNQGQLSSK